MQGKSNPKIFTADSPTDSSTPAHVYCFPLPLERIFLIDNAKSLNQCMRVLCAVSWHFFRHGLLIFSDLPCCHRQREVSNFGEKSKREGEIHGSRENRRARDARRAPSSECRVRACILLSPLTLTLIRDYSQSCMLRKRKVNLTVVFCS